MLIPHITWYKAYGIKSEYKYFANIFNSSAFCSHKYIFVKFITIIGDRSRGYTSKIGVIIIFDGELDIPIDYIVISKFCHECVSWKSRHTKGDISNEEYDAWVSGHVPSCAKNFTGTRYFLNNGLEFFDPLLCNLNMCYESMNIYTPI